MASLWASSAAATVSSHCFRSASTVAVETMSGGHGGTLLAKEHPYLIRSPIDMAAASEPDIGEAHWRSRNRPQQSSSWGIPYKQRECQISKTAMKAVRSKDDIYLSCRGDNERSRLCPLQAGLLWCLHDPPSTATTRATRVGATARGGLNPSVGASTSLLEAWPSTPTPPQKEEGGFEIILVSE
jgi:hypothetical protein